jgi:Tfp pilus assembly protein PilO
VSRSFRIVIAVALIGAAGAAYWMLLLSPKRKDAAALQKKVSVAHAQIAQAQSQLAEYERAAKSYSANYRAIVGLGKAVPADDDTRSLLVQLDTTAKRSGVSFANIDLQSSAGSSGSVSAAAPTAGAKVIPGAFNAGAFQEMPFTFAFSGDYETLTNFFARVNDFVTVNGSNIEVNGRLLRIDSIQLSPGSKGWPSIQAQIGASTYIVPDSNATASGPAGSTTDGAGSSTTTPGTTSSTSTTADLPAHR